MTRTPPRYDTLANLRYRDFSRVAERIDAAHAATARYLDRQARGR